jgi:hypothetical protein
MRVGMGLTCPTPADPSYPSGCPAGFTLQEMWYVPNSEVTNATASTPGAVQYSPTGNGCPGYICQNSQGQSPDSIAANARLTTCSTEAMAILAAGVAALIFLPGWSKLIALPAFYYSFGIGLCGQGL